MITSLQEMGGRGALRDVLPRVKAKIAHLLDGYYSELDPSGQVRWEHATHAAHHKLVLRDPGGAGPLIANTTRFSAAA